MKLKRIRSIIHIAALATAWTIGIATAEAQVSAADWSPTRGVDRAPGLPEERPPKHIAICIGIDGYSSEGYAPLHCAVNDAEDQAKAFAALGYETHLLTDRAADPAHRPTYENLIRELRHVVFSATEEEDTLVITFSGHGDAIGGMPVLLPLDYGTEHAPLSVNHLLDAELLGNPLCRARKKLLILDACHSAGNGLGQLISGMRVESCVLLSGCGGRQSSVEDQKLGHGHLTQAILDGLAGKGYAKDEKFLFVEDLEKYIHRRFDEEKWSSTQTPEFLGRITGKFDLAVRELPKPPPLSKYDRKMLARALGDARDAWNEKNYADAVDAATHALRIDEKNADALAERALAYMYLGYGDKALADAAAARALDPNQLLAMQVRGVTLIEMPRDRSAQREGFVLLQSVTATVDADPGRWPFLAGGQLAAVRWAKVGFGHTEFDHDYAAAATTCTRVIEMTDAPPRQLAMALINRGVACEHMGCSSEKMVADYSRAIEIRGATVEQVAIALVNRAIMYEWQQQPQKALPDYTRVIETKGAPVDQVARALVDRGGIYDHAGQPHKGLADYTRVIEMNGAPAKQVALALVNRGIIYASQSRTEKALADFSRVIEMKNAPVEQMALALVNRGIFYGARGHLEMEVADCTRVIEMKGAPANHLARALVNRGSAYGSLSQPAKELADFNRVIEMKDAPPNQVALALLNRAIANWKQGHPQETLVDCSRVIELKGAPAETVAMALSIGGVVHEIQGHPEMAAADYTRVIEMKDAPAANVTSALLRRARANYKLGRLEAALADSRRAVERDPHNLSAACNVALILLRDGKLAEARASYQAVMAQGVLAGAIDDLIELRDKLQGPPETAIFIGWLRIRAGKEQQGRDDLQSYLKDHPQGPISDWARQLLATPATRPAKP